MDGEIICRLSNTLLKYAWSTTAHPNVFEKLRCYVRNRWAYDNWALRVERPGKDGTLIGRSSFSDYNAVLKSTRDRGLENISYAIKKKKKITAK